MATALVVLNGPVENDQTVRDLAARADFIAAADGGLRHLIRSKIPPDIVLGDMDSLPSPLPPLRNTVYSCDFDENRSDFQKALDYLLSAEFDLVWVLGASGGRPDHAMVNMSIVEIYSKKIPIVLIGNGFSQVLGPGTYRFNDSRGARITLLSAASAATVSSKGLKFPLKNTRLKRDATGLGNTAVSKKVEIKVHTGYLWVFISGQ
jgi:thiamine pyrophosphokinase